MHINNIVDCEIMAGSYGVSSLNNWFSRQPVPLKIKEICIENIWVTVQGCSCLYSRVSAGQWQYKMPERFQWLHTTLEMHS